MSNPNTPHVFFASYYKFTFVTKLMAPSYILLRKINIMNSSSLLCSLPLLPRPFSGNLQQRPGKGHGGGVTRIPVSKRDAYNHNYDGKLVDENMIVLRKRIQEMKVAERNEEAPLHWMEWEKRYYAKYDSDICDMVGLLQSKLMETRPGLALAMAVVILLSVPTSTVVLLSHLISIIKGL